MAFNVFAFVGHGTIDDKDKALFLVNTKGGNGVSTVQTINVDDLAHEGCKLPLLHVSGSWAMESTTPAKRGRRLGNPSRMGRMAIGKVHLSTSTEWVG